MSGRSVVRAGIGARIAIAAIVVAALGVAIVAGGTLVFGGASFVHLMTSDGHPADQARAMFDASVGRTVAVALVVAVFAATLLAALVGRRLARPIGRARTAARRIASGDFGARIPADGPAELADLADSFNAMAAALDDQERLRREFIANAAHELRTPLTNLKGYLEALRDGVIPADRTTFESLWEEAERLVRLSRSLDLLADGDAGAAEPALEAVNVALSLRSAADLFGPSLRRAGLDFDVEIGEGLLARATGDGLAQVLANLLQNALRYTPPDGRVRLCAERRAGDVLVTVSNTGPGIPAADLPHVFERFYRVDKSRSEAGGGAGIGLAIVRQIVESFGGDVAIASRAGLTEVSIRLPAAS